MLSYADRVQFALDHNQALPNSVKGTKIMTEQFTADEVAVLKAFAAFVVASGTVVNVTTTEPAPAKKATTKAAPKAAAKSDPEPEPEADDADDNDRAKELGGKTLAALKKIAFDLGYEEEDVTGVKKDDLIDLIVTAEDEDNGDDEDEYEEDADDADADDDGDDDTDDDDDADAADDDEPADEDDDEAEKARLSAMNLRTLRKTVIAEFEVGDDFDVNKADKDAIIDYLFGDDDDADDADDEDADEDEDELTEEDLEAMTLAELKVQAKEFGVTVKRGMDKPALIKAIIDMSEVPSD